MEKTGNFKLIEGKFDPSEANSILFTLVNSKINFHSLESFGITERSSGDTSKHEKRILELRKANIDIKELLNFAVENDFLVKIESNIKIKFIKKPKKIPKKLSE